MKKGVPSNAVRIPIGSSDGATIVLESVSANVKTIEPANAEPISNVL